MPSTRGYIYVCLNCFSDVKSIVHSKSFARRKQECVSIIQMELFGLSCMPSTCVEQKNKKKGEVEGDDEEEEEKRLSSAGKLVYADTHIFEVALVANRDSTFVKRKDEGRSRRWRE